MITTLLDVLGVLLIVAAVAVFCGTLVNSVAVGLGVAGLLVLLFSWVLVRGGKR